MHALTTASRAGYTFLEVATALAILAAIAPAVIGPAVSLRSLHELDRARETVAGLIAEARWAGVRHGSATVEFTANPPHARVVAAGGDTIAAADLAAAGVALVLPRGRETSRIRYGPLGVGWVASQTLRFRKADRERSLVISSLGRVSRR